jgi:hypothetical protein
VRRTQAGRHAHSTLDRSLDDSGGCRKRASGERGARGARGAGGARGVRGAGANAPLAQEAHTRHLSLSLSLLAFTPAQDRPPTLSAPRLPFPVPFEPLAHTQQHTDILSPSSRTSNSVRRTRRAGAGIPHRITSPAARTCRRPNRERAGTPAPHLQLVTPVSPSPDLPHAAPAESHRRDTADACPPHPTSWEGKGSAHARSQKCAQGRTSVHTNTHKAGEHPYTEKRGMGSGTTMPTHAYTQWEECRVRMRI